MLAIGNGGLTYLLMVGFGLLLFIVALAKRFGVRQFLVFRIVWWCLFHRLIFWSVERNRTMQGQEESLEGHVLCVIWCIWRTNITGCLRIRGSKQLWKGIIVIFLYVGWTSLLVFVSFPFLELYTGMYVQEFPVHLDCMFICTLHV